MEIIGFVGAIIKNDRYYIKVGMIADYMTQSKNNCDICVDDRHRYKGRMSMAQKITSQIFEICVPYC